MQMTDSSPNCSIIINGLSLNVNIGITADERSIPQKIIVDLKIHFGKIPKGCISDDINETICYKSICDLILESTQKHYNIIEHFGFTIFNKLKKIVPQEQRIMLKIKKFPNIAELKNGVEFEINNMQNY